MIEEELGAMFKRIASMAEDRYSDYAVGKAVMDLIKTATTAIVEHPAPLSAAERMDRAAEVEKAIEDRISIAYGDVGRDIQAAIDSRADTLEGYGEEIEIALDMHSKCY